MKPDKPHIYKVGDFWFCKVVGKYLTTLGIGSDSPKEAYLNYYRVWRLTP